MRKILIERGATILDGVNPRVAMVKPTTAWISEAPDDQGEKERGHKVNMMYDTYMLIRTMPRDQTSAPRGLYTGATLFLHSAMENVKIRREKPKKGGKRTKTHIRGATTVHVR